MTAGWTSKALDEVCHFQNGLWKGEKSPFVTVGVIRNTNFTKEGSLDDSDIAYLEVEAKKFEKRRLQYGDIILEKSGGGPKQPVGRVALFDKQEGEFSFSNFTSALRVRDPDLLDFRYLHKYLHWIYLSGVTEQMQSHSTGIRNLDGNAYKAVQIVFPSVPNQQRIVAILDEAFAGIATAKANAAACRNQALQVLERCLAATFGEEALTWPEKSLSEYFHVGSSKRVLKSQWARHGVPFYRGREVTRLANDGRVDNELFISEELFAAFSRQGGVPAAGDIVITAIGTIGNAYVVRESDRFYFKDASVLWMKRTAEIDSQFVSLWIKSPSFFGQLDQGNGATVDTLTIQKLQSLKFRVPSLEEQARVVARLHEIGGQCARLDHLYTSKLAALDELKQSLLHRAFSGQL